jgi:hypothetical protein
VNAKVRAVPDPADGLADTAPRVALEFAAVVNDQTAEDVDPDEFLATTLQ